MVADEAEPAPPPDTVRGRSRSQLRLGGPALADFTDLEHIVASINSTLF